MAVSNMNNIWFVVFHNNIEALHEILSDPCMDTTKISHAIVLAARTGKIECLQILIERYPEYITNEALGASARWGPVECLKMLLQKKPPDLTDDENNIFGMAMSGSARHAQLELLWDYLDYTTTAPAQLIAYACLYNNEDVFNRIIPLVNPRRALMYIQNHDEYAAWDCSMLTNYIDTTFTQQEQYAIRALLEINVPAQSSCVRLRKI